MDHTPDDHRWNLHRPTTSATWLGEDDGLSDHEGAMLALIVLGLSNHEIARALHVSMYSTRAHVRAVYQKMGVVTRAQAITWGMLHGYHLSVPPARPDETG